MRALLVLVLAGSGCIDLDAFSAHYDAGVGADLSTQDLAGVDLAGEPCHLVNGHTIALSSPPPSLIPTVASLGHDATGTYFLLGVIDSVGQVEFIRYRLEDGATTSFGTFPCGSDCQRVRIARALATDATVQVAFYTQHAGQRWSLPLKASMSTYEGSVDCTPLSTFGGDVVTLGNEVAFNTNCISNPLDFVDENQMHHPLATWTGVIELRLARGRDGKGALIERDTGGTSIYRFDIAGATPAEMRLLSPTTANGVAIDMIDDEHVLAAGVPNGPPTLHLFVLSPSGGGMQDIDTGFQAANTVGLPTSVAAAKDGYLVGYHDSSAGAFGRFVDLDGHTGERFPIGGGIALGAQMAGDPDAPSQGPHGALLAAWLANLAGTLSIEVAQVECP